MRRQFSDRVMKSIVQVLFISAALFMPSGLAQGTIVFDNFGPNDSYSRAAAAGITFTLSRVAFPFTPQITGSLTSVDLPLFVNSGVNAADISVRTTDPVSGFPGAAVELFAVRGGVREEGSTDIGPTRYGSSLRPVLTEGIQYWLEVASAQGSSLNWYSVPELSGSALGYLRSTEGERFHSFEPPSAFRVTVDAVPEATPQTIILLGAAIFHFCGMRRRG
jgi:hypothetical protein